MHQETKLKKEGTKEETKIQQAQQQLSFVSVKVTYCSSGLKQPVWAPSKVKAHPTCSPQLWCVSIMGRSPPTSWWPTACCHDNRDRRRAGRVWRVGALSGDQRPKQNKGQKNPNTPSQRRLPHDRVVSRLQSQTGESTTTTRMHFTNRRQSNSFNFWRELCWFSLFLISVPVLNEFMNSSWGSWVMK